MFRVNELIKVTRGQLIQGRRDISVKGISIDSRTLRPKEAFVAIKGNKFDGHNFIAEAIKKQAGCIILSSLLGLAQNEKRIAFIEVKDTAIALGDIARFQRCKFDIPVVAITGTSGKTTTKEMIASILSKRFNLLKNEGTQNNHIGIPLTLFNLNRRHDIAVLELGTNHFGEIDYLTDVSKPNIGIITNIGPSHLEYFHNLAGVFKEKYTLVNNLNRPYVAILNNNDDLLRKEINKISKKTVIFGFGIKGKCDFSASDIKISNRKIEFLVNSKFKFSLKTLGYYNIYNALAAISTGRIFGLSYKEMADKLSTFNFPRGRLNLIKLNGINYIDDTYNSNPLSLGQALKAITGFKTAGKKIFIMGDMLELGDGKERFHYRAGSQAAKICDMLITVGELSKLSAQAAKAAGFDIRKIYTCASAKEAGDILFEKIVPKKEDIVLVKGSRLMKMEEVFKRDI